jgi:hypothetical protein
MSRLIPSSLRPTTWLLHLRAFATLMRVHRTLRHCRYDELRQFLAARQRQGPAKRNAMEIAHVMAAIERVCLWYVPRSRCLHRSAVLVSLLRRFGVDAVMVIGIRVEPYAGHAWVEVNGVVINDDDAFVKSYIPIDRV